MNKLKTITLNSVADLPMNFTGIVIYRHGVYDGATAYYLNGKLHREDGPAVEYKGAVRTGNKYWYLNGKRHRVDGPAVEIVDEKNGSLIHKEWYWDGEAVSPEEHFNKLNKEEIGQVVWDLDRWK